MKVSLKEREDLRKKITIDTNQKLQEVKKQKPLYIVKEEEQVINLKSELEKKKEELKKLRNFVMPDLEDIEKH